MVKLGNVRGRTIQLKVMVRAKEASKETAKFMGHGICDSYSRTVNLHVATNDPVIIQREAWHLLKQLNGNKMAKYEFISNKQLIFLTS